MSVIKKRQNLFSFLGQACSSCMTQEGVTQLLMVTFFVVVVVHLKQLMSVSKSYISKSMIFIIYFTKDGRNGENMLSRLFPSLFPTPGKPLSRGPTPNPHLSLSSTPPSSFSSSLFFIEACVLISSFLHCFFQTAHLSK